MCQWLGDRETNYLCKIYYTTYVQINKTGMNYIITINYIYWVWGLQCIWNKDNKNGKYTRDMNQTY